LNVWFVKVTVSVPLFLRRGKQKNNFRTNLKSHLQSLHLSKYIELASKETSSISRKKKKTTQRKYYRQHEEKVEES
jgi:hypothetical protein